MKNTISSAICLALAAALLSSCSTLSPEERWQKTFMQGPKETEWPFFKKQDETWVGGVVERIELTDTRSTDVFNNTSYEFYEKRTMLENQIHVADEKGVVIEVKFSSDGASVTYHFETELPSGKTQCVASWVDKTLNPDNIYAEFTQRANDCIEEKFVRVVRRSSGLLHVSLYSDSETISVMEGLLNRNKYDKESYFSYNNASSKTLQGLKGEYGARNIYLDRVGSRVPASMFFNQHRTLCEALTLNFNESEYDHYANYANRYDVHPDCVVSGKSVTLHALENGKYKAFDYLAQAGATLDSRDASGHSLSYSIAQHYVLQNKVCDYENGGLRCGVSFKTLSESDSFDIEDYLEGAADHINGMDIAQYAKADMIRQVEEKMARYERALKRLKRFSQR